ncbi:hypothetical protein DYB32_009301 [Aphanomyces invadans]|uniref:Uncharacterized protein n=1 Tax=Aphanomyces invadans TaxID=157072 RepID=A0A3R6Y1R0_9STRA|nr:hypothetical protein DYB32_009301 [Aphanomyces invadans]
MQVSPGTHEMCVVAATSKPAVAYISMNKKEMEAKMRELENWNFRLYLDEGKEIRRGQQLKVLTGEFPVPISGGVNGNGSVAASKEAATHEISTRTSAKRPRRM